jgi:hypothetical protein
MSRGSKSTRSGGMRVVADVSTSATANGSAKKLTGNGYQQTEIGGMKRDAHSAEAVIFPGMSNTPPIITTRPMRSRTNVPSMRSMRARLVSGPNTIYVTERGGWSRRRSNAT